MTGLLNSAYFFKVNNQSYNQSPEWAAEMVEALAKSDYDGPTTP